MCRLDSAREANSIGLAPICRLTRRRRHHRRRRHRRRHRHCRELSLFWLPMVMVLQVDASSSVPASMIGSSPLKLCLFVCLSVKQLFGSGRFLEVVRIMVRLKMDRESI